jgi:hypothetical protein
MKDWGTRPSRLRVNQRILQRLYRILTGLETARSATYLPCLDQRASRGQGCGARWFRAVLNSVLIAHRSRLSLT